MQAGTMKKCYHSGKKTPAFLDFFFFFAKDLDWERGELLAQLQGENAL